MEINHKWIVVLIALLIIGALILPFITPLVFGALIAYLLFPLHNKLRQKIGNKPSALLLTVVSLFIAIGVLFYGVQLVLNEFANFYKYFANINAGTAFSAGDELSEGMNNTLRFILSKVLGSLSSLVSRLPHIMLSILLFFISVFYFLSDGETLWKWLVQHIPLKPEERSKIIDQVQKYAYAYVYVWLLIGVAQGIIATLGFWLFGFKSPLVFGIIAAILSVLPIIGPYALYLPVGIMSALQGNFAVGAAVIVYGLTLGSILDYLVRPYFAGKMSSAHPFIILIGLLGGLLIMGPAGIIAGPIILLIATAVLKSVKNG